MTRGPVLAWYVHHHGAGHRSRAQTVGAALRTHGAAVTFLSSQVAGDDWVSLPSDADGPVAAGTETAHGKLHWAPLRHPGLRERSTVLAEVWGRLRPDLVVVDASVEVALLARLHGFPVAIVAAPGDRRDPPHALAYGLAETLIAPWPEWAAPLDAPAGSRPIHAVGAFSRYDGRAASAHRPRKVLVLCGSGGDDAPPGWLEAAAAAVPGWDWEVLRDAEDPWPSISAAALVITHAGQNAVAEVAAARRPAIVIAQPRPFGEQRATARVLDEAGICVGLPGWPMPGRPAAWPQLFDRALNLGGSGWARWSDGHGADRAAGQLLHALLLAGRS